MDEPGEVEAELLAIVVGDETQRLHLVFPVTADEAPSEAPTVFLPRCLDMFSVLGVHGEVVEDNLGLFEVGDIELRFEGVQDDRLELTTVETLELLSRVTLEGHHAVVFSQASLHVEDLGHEINDLIFEVDHDEDLFGVSIADELVIEDTSLTDKRVKLSLQNRESFIGRHEAVIGVFVQQRFSSDGLSGLVRVFNVRTLPIRLTFLLFLVGGGT